MVLWVEDACVCEAAAVNGGLRGFHVAVVAGNFSAGKCGYALKYVAGAG